MPSQSNLELLRAALTGLEHQREEIGRRIGEVKAMLNGKAKPAAVGAVRTAEPVIRRRRPMSAAAKKRIAAAQRKRWAEYHKAQTA